MIQHYSGGVCSVTYRQSALKNLFSGGVNLIALTDHFDELCEQIARITVRHATNSSRKPNDCVACLQIA